MSEGSCCYWCGIAVLIELAYIFYYYGLGIDPADPPNRNLMALNAAFIFALWKNGCLTKENFW